MVVAVMVDVKREWPRKCEMGHKKCHVFSKIVSCYLAALGLRCSHGGLSPGVASRDDPLGAVRAASLLEHGL